MSELLPDPVKLDIEVTKDDLKYWQTVFMRHHDIWEDHLALLKILDLDDDAAGAYFDS